MNQIRLEKVCEMILFIGGPVDWEGGPVDWGMGGGGMGDMDGDIVGYRGRGCVTLLGLESERKGKE